LDKFKQLPFQKQNKIIDAALLAFGANGYKKASVSDIAAIAGISKAMVFHYFGTKKELYLYLLRYCYDIISEALNEKLDISISDFFDRIMLSSEIKISVLNKHPATLSFLINAYYESNEEVKDEIKAILSQGEDFRNKIAFDGMDTSKFKDGVDPRLVLKILIWMAEGFGNSLKERGVTKENYDKLVGEYYECMDLLKKNLYKEECLN
jgi:TetR/AcrR family transcriptional regulator